MWKRGDTALCVSMKDRTGKPILFSPVEEGKTYGVREVNQCKCSTRLVIEGVENGESYSLHTCLDCKGDCLGYPAWRFIKLAGDDINTTEKQKEELPKEVVASP
jgi:hypothetical protein